MSVDDLKLIMDELKEIKRSIQGDDMGNMGLIPRIIRAEESIHIIDNKVNRIIYMAAGAGTFAGTATGIIFQIIMSML